MSSFHRKTPPEIPGYEITRLIGLGGMGEVYLAKQLVLNRPVAIKFLTRTAGDPTDEYDQRFRREAELMAKVSHPNVVTIFDFGTVGGRPYLVMEYIENGDLRSRMVPDVPMSIDEIRTIMRPVFRAMDYLHRQGIVHRDMKPENILMHSEETPKVTDFGIAVLDFAIGSLTRTGLSLGTPGYISPEQQYGLKVNERADQFSLAALCYEMATGRKPLGAYAPPSKVNPKLGSKAGAAILKGLSDDPNDRFATIAEFGQALEDGLIVGAARKPVGRRVGVAASVLALVGLLGLGLYVASTINKAPGQNPVIRGAVPPALAPDRIKTSAVEMTLVKILPGKFWMGSAATDISAEPNELPRHLVTITKPFYLGETEVTVAQFRTFVNAKDYKTTAETNGKGGGIFNLKEGKWEQRLELNWRNPVPGRSPKDNEPVVQVSCIDAIEFSKWLSEVEHRPFRLPTEAEWEYACRARTTTRWSSGDDPKKLDDFAWTLQNAKFVLHPVGTKLPNDFGLFDMHGNVWEWCSDRFSNYQADAVVDPKGPAVGSIGVLRGGSIDWGKIERTSSAARYNYDQSFSYCNYGFRVCSPIVP